MHKHECTHYFAFVNKGSLVVSSMFRWIPPFIDCTSLSGESRTIEFGFEFEFEFEFELDLELDFELKIELDI